MKLSVEQSGNRANQTFNDLDYSPGSTIPLTRTLSAFVSVENPDPALNKWIQIRHKSQHFMALIVIKS